MKNSNVSDGLIDRKEKKILKLRKEINQQDSNDERQGRMVTEYSSKKNEGRNKKVYRLSTNSKQQQLMTQPPQ